jgi:hypothetical protein
MIEGCLLVGKVNERPTNRLPVKRLNDGFISLKNLKRLVVNCCKNTKYEKG